MWRFQVANKGATQTSLARLINKLSRKYRPEELLQELSTVYEEYMVGSPTEAEADYWLKCSKATKNLSSGMEKWLYEMVDDLEEEQHEKEE